jgi:hypothetical protein
MVVVVGQRSVAVSPSETLGDKRVVGVVAAQLPNDNGAAVVATQKLRGRSVDVAVAGVVMCKADATTLPIQAGDLLISSNVRGHAMRAMGGTYGGGTLTTSGGSTFPDAPPANGAILGKALAPLASGRGTIPILIALG